MANIYITELIQSNQSQSQPKQEDINKVQSEYLSFLIQQEPKFANIDSIESFFLKDLHLKHIKYNTNKSLLLKKQQEYSNLIQTIDTELKHYYTITTNHILQYFNSELSSYSHIILERQHDQKSYRSMYNRLYHSNFMIKKRIETEIAYEAMNAKQISQYEIINNNALVTMSKKQDILNQMKVYAEHYAEKNYNEVEEKEKQSNLLQYQVEVIKKDTSFLERKLKKYYDKSKEVSTEINRVNQVNAVYKQDYLSMKKEYHKVNVQLMMILKHLHSKQLDKFIVLIRDKRIEYNNVISTFHYYNNEVIKHNTAYRALSDRLDKVNKEIILKQREKGILYDSVEIRRNQSKTEQMTYISTQLSKEIKRKVSLLQYILYFFIKQGKRIIKQDSETLSHCKCKLIYDLLTKEKKLREYHMIPLDGIDNESIKILLRLFHWYTNQLILMYYNRLNCISNQDRDPFNPLIINNDNEYDDIDYKDQHIEIIDIQSLVRTIGPQGLIRTKQLQSQQSQSPNQLLATKTSNNRKLSFELSNRNNKDELNTISTNALSKIKHHPEGKITTQTAMLKKFMTYLNDMSSKLNKTDEDYLNEFIKDKTTSSLNGVSHEHIFNTNPKRLTSLFSKYQNDLVVNDNVYNIFLKQIKNQKRNRKLKSNDALHLPPNDHEALILLNQTSTSSDEESLKDNSYNADLNENTLYTKRLLLKQAKSNYNNKHNHQWLNYKNDPDMTKISQRQNDIKGLEKRYYKEKEIGRHNEDFNRNYVNAIRKDNSKYKSIESQYSYKNMMSNRCNRTFCNRKGSVDGSSSTGLHPSCNYEPPLSNTNRRTFYTSNRLLIKNKSMPHITSSDQYY